MFQSKIATPKSNELAVARSVAPFRRIGLNNPSSNRFCGLG